MHRNIYFVIGTVAEFLKVMPVMQELSRRQQPFKIIASGQNALDENELIAMAGVGRLDIVLSDHPIAKSPISLFLWFFRTLIKGLFRLRREFRGAGADTILVVHGDTVTTVMGALIGKYFGLRVAHIEAGYRSFNFLQPFPEELDRYLTSFMADIHFCPYQGTVDNLRNRKGLKVNTQFNTNIDSLLFALSQSPEQPLPMLNGVPYFVFIMHRQENLLNKTLVRDIVSGVLKEAAKIKCVFVMHSLTRSVLKDLGLLDSVEQNCNVIVAPRLPYFKFIALLNHSEFLLTDGGGNQQETYYMGKPCLILRNVTEGIEGVGHNVVISGNKSGIITDFMNGYEKYRKPMIHPDVSPSSIIANTLISG